MRATMVTISGLCSHARKSSKCSRLYSGCDKKDRLQHSVWCRYIRPSASQ